MLRTIVGFLGCVVALMFGLTNLLVGTPLVWESIIHHNMDHGWVIGSAGIVIFALSIRTAYRIKHWTLGHY